MPSFLASLADALEQIRRRQLLLAALAALGVERGAQERDGGDARDFQRILERQEHALGGALVRRHRQQVLALEQDLATGDLVAGLAGQHIGQRRLAGAVRAHDGVDLAGIDPEIEAVENLPSGDFGPKTADFQEWRHRRLPPLRV